MQRQYDVIRRLNAEVVAIGQGTAREARDWCGRAGVAFPCLGDPEKESYRAFAFPRGSLREVFVGPMLDGNRAVRQGHRVSLRGSLLSHSDWFQLPGVAIVDRAGILRYYHRARHSGDLPATLDVIAALKAL